MYATKVKTLLSYNNPLYLSADLVSILWMLNTQFAICEHWIEYLVLCRSLSVVSPGVWRKGRVNRPWGNNQAVGQWEVEGIIHAGEDDTCLSLCSRCSSQYCFIVIIMINFNVDVITGAVCPWTFSFHLFLIAVTFGRLRHLTQLLSLSLAAICSAYQICVVWTIPLHTEEPSSL